MAQRAQNGWPGLHAGDHRLHRWTVPATTGHATFTLREGSAGFILCHFLLWFAEVVEPIAGKILDDWGHAWRDVREGTDLSNHAAGCAADVNALRHVLGRSGTFSASKTKLIRSRLLWAMYAGCLRWGGNYHGRKDEMHVEIVRSLAVCERVARALMRTPRGKRLLAANPGQRAVILS